MIRGGSDPAVAGAAPARLLEAPSSSWEASGSSSSRSVQLSLPADVAYAWSARVAFVKSPELQMPFQGLLGTEGFLDKFAVTFNKYYDYFVLERPDDFHERVGAPLIDDPVTAPDPQWERPGR